MTLPKSPWAIRDIPRSQTKAYRECQIIDADANKLFSVHGNSRNIQAIASAAAAGPEMLELLSDIAAHLEGGATLHAGSLIFREDAPALDVINSAIAKARGQA